MKDVALAKLREIEQLLDQRVGDINQRHKYSTEFHVWVMSDEAFEELKDLVGAAIDEVDEIEEAEEE